MKIFQLMIEMKEMIVLSIICIGKMNNNEQESAISVKDQCILHNRKNHLH